MNQIVPLNPKDQSRRKTKELLGLPSPPSLPCKLRLLPHLSGEGNGSTDEEVREPSPWRQSSASWSRCSRMQST